MKWSRERPSSHITATLKKWKRKIFIVRIYSPNNFHLQHKHITVLVIFTVLYILPLVLIHLITVSLYNALSSGNHTSDLFFFMSLFVYEVQLTYNILLVLGTQHSNLFLYLSKYHHVMSSCSLLPYRDMLFLMHFEYPLLYLTQVLINNYLLVDGLILLLPYLWQQVFTFLFNMANDSNNQTNCSPKTRGAAEDERDK